MAGRTELLCAVSGVASISSVTGGAPVRLAPRWKTILTLAACRTYLPTTYALHAWVGSLIYYQQRPKEAGGGGVAKHTYLGTQPIQQLRLDYGHCRQGIAQRLKCCASQKNVPGNMLCIYWRSYAADSSCSSHLSREVYSSQLLTIKHCVYARPKSSTTPHKIPRYPCDWKVTS